MTTLSGPPVVSARNLLTPDQVGPALVGSVKKLDPRALLHQPVIFVVWVGSILATLLFFRDLRSDTTAENVFTGLTAIFLWITVLFANFAEAMAEGRGKAQAENLRRTRSETVARVRRGGRIEEVTGSGRDVKAVIDFDDAAVGRKTIKLAYTTLEKGSA